MGFKHFWSLFYGSGSVFAAIHMGFKALCTQEPLKPMCRAANNECSCEYCSEYSVFADRYMGFKVLCSQECIKPMCRAANSECSSEYYWQVHGF